MITRNYRKPLGQSFIMHMQSRKISSVFLRDEIDQKSITKRNPCKAAILGQCKDFLLS